MTMILLLLKIIGCALLVILILLVFLILLLLFVPLRYRISANSGDEPQISFGISWLLHLVALTGLYEAGKFHLKLRVFFWRKQLMDTEQAKETAAEGEEAAEESLRKAAEEVTDDSNLWEIPEEEKQDSKVLQADERDRTDADSSNKADAEDRAQTGHTQGTHHKKRGIPVFIQLAQDFVSRIQELWKDADNVINKIKSISDDSKCRSALTHLKEELFLLLKMFWPRKLRMNLQFSAGTPDKTGQILGVCAMFPVTYSNGNVLVPDFETEEAYVKGWANLKGRVYLYQIVGIAIRVIFDKNCKRLLHRLQTLRS